MIKGPIVLNRVVDGNGYVIEEINTHEHYSIYEYVIYRNGIEINRGTRTNILDAIQTAGEWLA